MCWQEDGQIGQTESPEATHTHMDIIYNSTGTVQWWEKNGLFNT